MLAGPSKKIKVVPDLKLPWVEKYRPKTLDDVVGNPECVERLKVIARDGNMPHMILSGAPGVGKTTAVHCLARELLGEQYNDSVLELNASDDRGIDVVRGKIKAFAQKHIDLQLGRHKVVILDEADSMTPGAQQALRRTMEQYAKTTRFVFACNLSNKIIEPLQSRCAILRFGKLTNEEMLRRLLQIIKAEDVKYSDDGLSALLFCSEGDMRQAINNLQSTVSGFGFVSGDNVYQIVDQPHPLVVKSMLEACREHNLELALDRMDELWNKGYGAIDIVTTLFRVAKTFDGLSDFRRLDIIKEVGFTHIRVLEGLNSRLQIAGLLSRLAQQDTN